MTERIRICLRRGPRDGEIHEVQGLGARALFVGNWEERRFAGYSDYGTKLWSYPTVVYRYVGWDGPTDLPLYEYDRTEPA